MVDTTNAPCKREKKSKCFALFFPVTMPMSLVNSFSGGRVMSFPTNGCCRSSSTVCRNKIGTDHNTRTKPTIWKKKEEQKKNENSIRRVFNFIVHSENGMNAENGHGQSHGQQHYHDSSNIRNQITGNTEPYRLQHRTQQTHTLTLTHTHDELQKRK